MKVIWPTLKLTVQDRCPLRELVEDVEDALAGLPPDGVEAVEVDVAEDERER